MTFHLELTDEQLEYAITGAVALGALVVWTLGLLLARAFVCEVIRDNPGDEGPVKFVGL